MGTGRHFVGIGVVWTLLVIAGCGKTENKSVEITQFSKKDSLTETCLSLQDAMLAIWNTMIHDDNRKIQTMHQLVRELKVLNPGNTDELDAYEQRLDDLLEMRYDRQSMSNPQLITEYDFASNSLVAELIVLAESEADFPYHASLQQLVDSIRSADQRVMNYRAEYDDIAKQYNQFIERNREILEIAPSDTSLRKRPLFQMAADETNPRLI